MKAVAPRLAGYLAVVLGGILASSTLAQANPWPPSNFETATGAIFYAAVLNLPIDLFVFSLILWLLFRELGDRAGKIDTDTARFLGRIVAGGALIAVVGALIDFYFFFHKAGNTGYYFWIYFTADFISSESPGLAALSVAASVYAVSLLMVRLNRVLSLLPAFALGQLNLLVWMANDELWIRGDSLAFQAGLFTAAAAAMLYLLFRWHAKFSMVRNEHHVYAAL